MTLHQHLTSRRLRHVPVSLLALLATSSGFGQQAAPAAATTPAPSAEDDSDVVVLSPFEVVSTQDKGYFAANTLAGSRLNTNLADLGASISVITMQQMEDTASTDLNDIFRYEVNTEGALTYTPGTQSMRNDGVLDVNAGGTQGNSLSSYTVAGANRVRGLGSPSAAINYFPSIGAVPFDSYNTQSVEISRGPNSMLFGLGSPAGIANQSTASANLNRQSGRVEFRFDQYGSFRNGLRFNQPLIKDKLAIYGAALFDERQFDRKPSYDRTKRLYGALTFKPFKTTTIKANVEKYENDNRRPNTLTPRDYVTEWNKAGQPYYDATTHKIMSLATGQALSMVVDNASSPYANDLRNFIATLPGYDASKWNSDRSTYNGVNIFGTNWSAQTPTGIAPFVAGQPFGNILFVPGIATSSALTGRSNMQIADGQLVNWFQPTYGYKYLKSFGTAADPTVNPTTYPSNTNVWANPTWADYNTRTWTSSTGWSAIGNGIFGSSYRYASVTDKSIYDWTKVNLNSMNFGTQRNTTYNVELDQQLPWDLHFNAGWLRQDFFQRTNYTVAQLNVSTLYVDTNKYLPDGTLNPYFGKPYLEDQDPDSYVTEELDDHYRAMLAWTPDFTRNKGWTKWFGRHQILGMWSRDEYMTTTIRQRLGYVDASGDAVFRYLRNMNNKADGTPTGWRIIPTNGATLRRTFYLASPDDPNGVVTQSAGYWDYLSYSGNISAYDYDSSSFKPMNVTTAFTDMDSGTGRNQRIVDSLSAGTTSYLWNERIIATFGVRQDKYKARVTNTGLPAIKDSAGNELAPAITEADKFVNGVFQRDFLFNRWGPYSEITGTTRTLGGVFRPFKGWTAIEQRASNGSVFWQFVRSFGLSYNKSDNFNPPSTAYGDYYGNKLAKPTGDGKDYGFQFSLFDDKLFARVTWFESSYQHENIAAPVAFGRVTGNIDTTLFQNWARTIARINMGDDPTSEHWNDAIPAASEKEKAIQAAAEKIWQLPYAFYSTTPYTIGATRNADAKGVEAEINYTPTQGWTMKATFGKQDTTYSDLYPELAPWLAERMAVWQSAKASDYLLPQYQHFATYSTYAATGDGRQVDLTNFWSSYGYNSNVFPERTFANPEANYNGVVLPQLMLDRDLEGQSVQGQRKYRASFLTTYTFDQGRLKGFSIGGNERWESKAVIGYYGKASGVNLYNGVAVLDMADISRPIYDKEHYYTDMWISYRRAIFKGKIQMKIQLNVNNVFENGGLRPVAVNYDGTPYSFRIVDPRQYVLTTTFDF
ncbi:MAG: TonB-dependent receptor [Opitutaceae bacterium]